MRQSGNAVSWCSVSQSTEVQNLLTAYNALSSEVKAIVDASEDYTYGKDVSSANYFLSEVDTTTYTIGQTLAYVSGYTPVESGGGSGLKFLNLANNNNSFSWIIIVSALVAVGGLAALFLIRKRKKVQK